MNIYKNDWMQKTESINETNELNSYLFRYTKYNSCIVIGRILEGQYLQANT